MSDPSQVGEARRLAAALARRLGLRDTDAGRVAVVVTEAARNLVTHATGGEVLLGVADGEPPGVEVLALDRGPGIADLAASLRDGYSTAGTPGTGLGAVSRMSSLFDIHSVPGLGTALVARVFAAPPPSRLLRVGGVCLPRPGETVSGDGWARVEAHGRTLLLVADGLGHGPGAAEASAEAIAAFHRQAANGPEAVLEAAHGALRSTRGAAVAVAEVDPERRVVGFAGVGNVAAAVLSGRASRHLVSHNGTLGHALRKVQLFTYPWPADGVLVMHSDGLVTHWSLDRYPGLARRDPALVAATLYRDFARGRDDVTVVAARSDCREPARP